ncbi:MAG: 2Fe-2S iron-sulfur cluster binding domain-containing protein [Erysipelotrichaceae bacterium]|jgi:ferredoxin|nr:2Fe-2S iron-sulfur cluster binding domain-containing protein [Erysipelotrichaceae bacterium]
MVSYQIEVSSSGERISCKDDESVLRALYRNNIKGIVYGCFGGGCGRCKIQVIDGTWNQFKPMSAEHISADNLKNGLVLACCITPTSDLRIRFVL